jgi:AcrR family transcriptional regulator
MIFRKNPVSLRKSCPKSKIQNPKFIAVSKGEQTKGKIIQQAAELFNQQGYAGSSMSDIMRVTGLKKGGIYNHFQSKDELALQAFDYAIACIQEHYRMALQGKRHAIDRLQAIVNAFGSYAENPPIKGGCPILNTAIESDDAHPALRDRAQQAMDSWRNMICGILKSGIKKGEVYPDVDADEIATIVIATVEGAVMMSKLYGDAIHLTRALNYLNQYLENYRV